MCGQFSYSQRRPRRKWWNEWRSLDHDEYNRFVCVGEHLKVYESNRYNIHTHTHTQLGPYAMFMFNIDRQQKSTYNLLNFWFLQHTITHGCVCTYVCMWACFVLLKRHMSVWLSFINTMKRIFHYATQNTLSSIRVCVYQWDFVWLWNAYTKVTAIVQCLWRGGGGWRCVLLQWVPCWDQGCLFCRIHICLRILQSPTHCRVFIHCQPSPPWSVVPPPQRTSVSQCRSLQINI